MKWFVGAILLLTLAVVFGLELLAYAMYALLATMVVSRFLAQSWIAGLSAERECNTLHAEIGDTVAVIVNVRNTGRLPVAWVLMEDLLPRRALAQRPPALEVAGEPTKLAMLPAGGTRPLLYQVTCRRRGYYQLGPLVLETGDLFGLHRRWRVATEPHFVLVYPKVVPLQGYDVVSRRPIGEVRMSYRLFEDPTRIAGVRRYEAGDPLNRVNWRATARTGQLHSKVYEPSTVAGATILLEFHRRSYDPRHEPNASDLAVTTAASIANALYEMGQQVGLITNGRDAADRIRTEGWEGDIRSREAARRSAVMLDESDRIRPVIVETRRGPAQLTEILRALARVEPGDGMTLAQLIAETGSHMPRDATVLAILPGVTPEAAISLGNLRRRGYAVTAIVDVFDPFAFTEAAGPLMAQGIAPVQLRDESSIPTICRRLAFGGCQSAAV
jgi:uncharacterized repeat protein (TIGR01451 family)